MWREASRRRRLQTAIPPGVTPDPLVEGVGGACAVSLPQSPPPVPVAHAPCACHAYPRTPRALVCPQKCFDVVVIDECDAVLMDPECAPLLDLLEARTQEEAARSVVAPETQYILAGATVHGLPSNRFITPRSCWGLRRAGGSGGTAG